MKYLAEIAAILGFVFMALLIIGLARVASNADRESDRIMEELRNREKK